MHPASWRFLPLVTVLAACGGGDRTPADPPAQYITVKRAWKPGERDSTINAIMANHSLVFPYVGDISALAPQIYADPDSYVVMVPNPLYNADVVGPTAPAILMAPQFSTAWTFVGAKITTINQDTTPVDTIFWHSILWRNPANALDHGFVIAFSRAATFNISQINSTTFDNALGKSGAGAGEFHGSTGTFWADVGSGGNFQMTSEVFPGAFSTVTTGPYLGGQQRAGTMYGRVFNSTFVRQPGGTELPTTFTVSFDYRGTGLSAVELLCIFPTPCTTNVPGVAAATH